jgi:acyl carrier protein
MSDHFKEVRAILMEHFAVAEEDIAMETELIELGMDSLDEVEIELDIERRYDIEIPIQQVFVTVGDFVRYLDHHFAKEND